MGTIQRQLRLQPGGDGGWNEEAQRRLENLLANPKRTGKQLALEDKKSKDKKPASDSSSSDSSSSDSGRSSEEAPQAASMELEVAKAKLDEKTSEMRTLQHDFEGIFSAQFHTSAELGKMKAENADQRMLIDSLIEENSNLRRQLEAHGREDVSRACDDEDVSPSSSSSEPELTFDHSSADGAMASNKQY